MRTRRFRALVVSVLFAFVVSAVPVVAAPRDHDGGWLNRDFPYIGKVIQKIRKAFGVSSNADTLTLPTP